MERLQLHLAAAQRPELFALLARGVHELTLRARYFYDAPDAADRMHETNEAIHRVSGHLRALLDPDCALTASRVEGIAEALSLLTPAALDRLLAA